MYLINNSFLTNDFVFSTNKIFFFFLEGERYSLCIYQAILELTEVSLFLTVLGKRMFDRLLLTKPISLALA